jgi:hypothetical protein
MQSTAISTPRKEGFRKTLPSLERPVHVVAERELITQNCEWKKEKKENKKKKKKRTFMAFIFYIF